MVEVKSIPASEEDNGEVKTYPSRKASFYAGKGKQISQLKKIGMGFMDWLKTDHLRLEREDPGGMGIFVKPEMTRKEKFIEGGAKRVAEFKKASIKRGKKFAKKPSSVMGSQTNWQRTRRGGLGLLSVATGTRLPGVYNPYALSKGKRGRPRGPSGKYIIPGKGAVSVYKYRKWAAQQRKLARLRSAQREYTDRFEGPYEPRSYAQRDYYEEEQEYTPERRSFAGGPTGEPRRDTQNILAPVPNILNAPNVFRGELRNVGERGFDVRERPVNIPVINPRGDEYLDVDPLTGKYILKKRPREKWLSGERRGII